MTGAPSSGVQLLPVLGFCQAAATARTPWDVTGGLSASVWCLVGDTGSLTVPVVPTTLIRDFFTGASALGSDFVCNLSFERPLGAAPA